MIEFKTRLEEDCQKALHDKERLRVAANEFSKNGYLKIEKSTIFSDFVLAEMRTEAFALLELNKVRRDVTIKTTDNTFRKMSNVSAADICKYDGVINQAYISEGLTALIGKIADDEILKCWEDEWYIINYQHEAGDTHGWHWGDYPYTLIWVVEAPSVKHGGLLQCVPHTVWNKKNPQVNRHLVENPISTTHHNSGDCYLLKSDTTLHRATPIVHGVERVIINTCWASANDTRHADEIDRGSMTEAFV